MHNKRENHRTSRATSWEKVENWYDKIVDSKGHYYHEQIILPHLLKHLPVKKPEAIRLLDLACGQGVLERALPPSISYTGVDIAASLIRSAKKESRNPQHQFLVGDVTLPLPLPKTFTHAAIILALQNIHDPLAALKNASSHLQPDGKLFLVLNHPCFRIPRQSSWQIDAQKKIQYRRVDRYLSPLEIPIQAHPSQSNSPETLSFHYPLSALSAYLKEAGFVIELMEEWHSDKKSSGAHARMEDRCRKEFPLFLMIAASKKT